MTPILDLVLDILKNTHCSHVPEGINKIDSVRTRDGGCKFYEFCAFVKICYFELLKCFDKHSFKKPL